MIVWLVIGIALAFLLLMLLNWWAKADAKTAKSSLFWAIIAVCAVISAALIVSGRGIAAILPVGFTAWRLFGSRTGAMQQGGQSARRDDGRMSVTEAREVLGITERAGEDEINAAYRKLMAKYHPDKGGNDWMASKLNEARQTLLDRK